ncbi:hypothetical protein [Longimicrobium sp.]|uniref:hypothetical protein n=1 Tax=Longimicrobium sp. TaxID=2029185 RepID=UPI002C029F6E|nr:hypothetical protein [Longimicrobium sp.]HSU17280.1 hypothetical protein [Longimicrobium sp.]
MRKVLYTAAALMLCAAPVHAQQAVASHSDAAPATQLAQPQAVRTPSLYPSTDEVRSQVAAAESKRVAPMGSKDWWYLVAAVAVGVIIAVVLLG